MLHKSNIDPKICPALTTLAQHLTDNRSVSACTLWTHHRQQKALSSIEWLMARIGHGGPALNRHWAECSVCWAVCCRRVGRWYGSTKLSGKHGVFTQCCFNAGPPSSTLAQHWNSIGWMIRVYWGLVINHLTVGGETSPLPVFDYKNDGESSSFVSFECAGHINFLVDKPIWRRATCINIMCIIKCDLCKIS